VVGIIEHFEELPEPRSSVNRRHLLLDIIVISVCGMIFGADGPAAIERWARLPFEWLKKHLKLPHGIPRARHDRPRLGVAAAGGVLAVFRRLDRIPRRAEAK